jgi:hypothetical protein
MFLALGLVLLVCWALGFFAFHALGAVIHLVLVLAIISILWHFITGTRTRSV